MRMVATPNDHNSNDNDDHDHENNESDDNDDDNNLQYLHSQQLTAMFTNWRNHSRENEKKFMN